MLKKLELKNYKSHKHFTANFNGNSLIQGNKGSGKTSLKDAFYWIMTGSLVDDPTPVDENGAIINHLTISAEATFEDGLVLKIESAQVWVKEKITTRHGMTYFVNGTPMIQRDYLAYLAERFGTLEQRKIMLDPTWFADGDGLRIAGKTPKTATQRRREIVIGAVGAEDLETKIAQNEEKAKQAKYALSQYKKDLDAANSGIESLHQAKVDVSTLDKDVLNETIAQLAQEKKDTENTLQSMSANDTLQQVYNDALIDLSNARTKYSLEYDKRLEQAQKPLHEYLERKQALQEKYSQIEYANRKINEKEHSLLNEIKRLEEDRIKALEEYKEVEHTKYSPDSVICQCCGQVLPQDKLREHEARFNKQRSDNLERIVNRGKEIAHDLAYTKKQLELLDKKHDTTQIEEELAVLVEPVVERPTPFEETEEYDKLNGVLVRAHEALQKGSSDSIGDIYKEAISNIEVRVNSLYDDLNKFKTNEHLDKQIEMKGEELQEIASNMDKQQEILDGCNEFTRSTLEKLETDIENVFDGIRFKMFEYTLDGTQKDTCITYGKTDVGYIPWENLSGGQKRSATISLSNAFAKAWGIDIPLWIDDTQIYSDDEIKANMQLIRITEVPYAKLEVK